MIKADNYNYTKNINDFNIHFFEKSMESTAESESEKYSKTFNFKNKPLSDLKILISQVTDFLKEYQKDFIVVFDGDSGFQIWGNFTRYVEDSFNEKFSKFISKKKRIDLFKVNKNNGLVSCIVKDVSSFSRKNCTIDIVYKKLLNKKFDWKKEGKLNLVKAAVEEYFKFKHDQIKEMYSGNNKLEDRDKDNFYRQVRKVKANLTQPLSSNPPYVGDMLENIKKKEEEEKEKVSNIVKSYLKECL